MDPWPSTPELLRRLYSAVEPPEAVAWDLPSFLAAYTLHDSGLAEVRLEQSDGLLVLINWDMHWNKRVLPEYRNLVIGIPLVYSVQWAQGGWNQDTLSGAVSERVSQEECGRMLENGSVDLSAYQGARDDIPPPFEDEGLTRTTFQSMNWSRLTVLHGGNVRLLCLNEEGQAGHLPTVGE
jgi:hypothetical protein